MGTEQKDPNSATASAVLYVDDEARSLKYFALAFGTDFPIRVAASVAEAETVLRLEADRIGVLVTDQRMPVETGVQLLDRVKQRHPQIVRLLTTAYADLEDAMAAVNRGEIHRYILKPWDIPALRAELHGAMELHRRKRQERDLLEARRRTMMSLASHIAHELSTPLATIRAAAGNLDDYWPVLVQTHRRQGPGSEDAAPIPDNMLELLEQTPGMILSMVDRANMLVRLLLMNTAEDAEDRSDYTRFSVSRCVLAAIGTYPFREGERGRVRLEGPDFEVIGSEVLVTYVIYNLLKNALYAIGTARKGDILIRTLPGEARNLVLFRDTGSGIPSQVLPFVFDEFYTGKSSGRGTGMGLPFCRRVMQALGGSIACRSELGQFTELELAFPLPGGPGGPDSLLGDGNP
jgi:two-component system response regulator PhcR